MALYIPADIDVEPEIELTQWAVWEMPDGGHHFTGRNIRSGDGRVSSEIVEFDRARMIGRTRSGRTYKLHGGPGGTSDATYVFGHWLAANRIDPDSVKGVSDEYVKLDS